MTTFIAISHTKTPFVVAAICRHEDSDPYPAGWEWREVDPDNKPLPGAIIDEAGWYMPVPAKVTAAQAKLALYNAGLLDNISQAVQGYPPMKIYFDFATEWHRTHPYVLGMGQELGLSDAQIDELFRQAEQL